MLVDIALAKDGFINRKKFAPPKTDGKFDTELKNFLDFTQKDLQNFDGVSFQMINSFDPTNSIFIYKNDTGKFLYQIQTASPSIHKNNLIWNCSCVQMQDIGILENIATSRSNVLIKRNIFAQNYKQNEVPLFTNQVKGNFKPLNYYIKDLGIEDADGENSAFLLKIKCMVDPTNSNLISNASDGSFNFAFWVFVKSGKIETNFTMVYGTSGTSELNVNLGNILSTYSPNIKSIEIIPFETTFVDGANILNYVDNEIRITDETIATPTPLGIYLKNFNLNYNIATNLYTTTFPKTLYFGGGVKAYFKTPLGIYDLNIEDYNINDNLNNGDVIIKTENDGFSIYGCVRGYVSPHYLNFYTDNAGQVFIQNLTTNAMELRNINRETASEYKQNQIDYNAKQSQQVLTTAQQVASNLGNLDVFGAIKSTVGGQLSMQANQIQYGYDLQKQQEKYSLAKAKFEDKLQTESLLASLTGKTLNGNSNIEDFLMSNSKHMKLIFETNFTLGTLKQNQTDYDFSVDFHINHSNKGNEFVENFLIETQLENNIEENQNVIVNNWNSAFDILLGFKTQTQEITNIPIYRDFNSNRKYCNLQYSVIFQIINIATTPSGKYAEFSNDIILPIRIRLY